MVTDVFTRCDADQDAFHRTFVGGADESGQGLAVGDRHGSEDQCYALNSLHHAKFTPTVGRSQPRREGSGLSSRRNVRRVGMVLLGKARFGGGFSI